MSRFFERRGLLLALVGALSVLVHLKGLRAPLLDYHYHRQVNTACIARNYAREHRPIWRPRIDWEGPEDRLAATELPVYMWLYGKLWPVGGLGEIWGRIISVIASALTAILLFLFFDREFDRESAFYGACLFSLIPLEIYFGRTVQPEATALLGLVASLYFWDISLERKRPVWAFMAAAFGAFLAVGSKLPYAHLFIPLAALTWRKLGKKTFSDRRMWAAGLLSMSGVLAWYLWARNGVYVVPTHGDEFAKLFDYRRTLYFIQFLVCSRFLEVVTTYGGLVLFLLGARETLLRRREPFWLAWLLGTFAHLFALGYYAHSHDYTALPLAPVAAGLMGLGAARLRAVRRPWAPAAAAFLFLSVPLHAALRIPHWYHQGLDYRARAGEAAAAVSLPDDLFVAGGAAPSVLLYYLDRRGWWTDLPKEGDAAWPFLQEKAKAGARFAASEKTGAMAEPDGALWKRLRARGKPVWDDGRLVVFALR